MFFKILFEKEWQTKFLKNISRVKTRYKKIMRLTQCIIQVGTRFCKNFFLKNVQYSG